jgi:hypothetical protein
MSGCRSFSEFGRGFQGWLSEGHPQMRLASTNAALALQPLEGLLDMK